MRLHIPCESGLGYRTTSFNTFPLQAKIYFLLKSNQYKVPAALKLILHLSEKESQSF